ncbi:MAG TPA: OadG family protein [Rectinemataceae bacterium]
MDKWMILLAGVGTVFAALVAIIAMLGLFRFIFAGRPEKKRAGPAPLPEMSSPRNGATVPSAVVPVAADQELIAVLAAAVAAASGKPLSSFRIAGVEPSFGSVDGFNTPAWGRIERFTRK